MKKAIVFGGAGFLGSHIADALSDTGYGVKIFDLKKSSTLRDAQEMIIGDILDEDAVSRAIEGCDYVYHLAGLADLDDASTRPSETVIKNILGTALLLEISRKASIERFVYASTIYVYSNKGGFYRCSKQAAELYIEEYQKRYGLDFTILRYGTLYGPRANEKNSVHRYINQALKENCITYSGTGEEIREYIHVRDAAKLSVEILSEDYRNDHIIITGHHPMKFKDLLEMINEIMNSGITFTQINAENNAHYSLTPYSFAPKIGRKLTSNCYTDMGQGLLECIDEIYKRKIV